MKKRVGERLPVARLDDDATCVLLDKPRNLSIFGRNGNHRPAGRRNTVELAWNDQTLEFRLQRYPMHVRNAQRVHEQAAILIGEKTKHPFETTLLYACNQFLEPVSTSDAQEHNARMILQALRCGEHGL